MSQLYVPDGAITTCLDGKSNSAIKVKSQTTVKINGKLKATEKDRFSDNFFCQKMVVGTSSAMGFIGTAIGSLGGPVGAFVGYIGGRFLGGLFGNQLSTNLLPSLCSTLCTPSKWTVVHPKVKISGKRALLEKANLRCMMGGIIYIVIPNMKTALTMANLAKDSYNNGSKGETDGYKEVDAARAEELLGDKWQKLLNQDKKNGFYAALYEDSNGNVVIAYRGTDPGAGINDIKEDYVQAMGISSDQYNASVDLARKIQKAKENGDITGDVTITGHSLGGGLATIAGAATGYPTYTYNAAAVHEETYQRNGVDPSNTRHIQAYVGTKDPLNGLQDNREVVLSGGVMVAPALPVAGTAIGSLGGAPGMVLGGAGGTAAGMFLGGSGLWGLQTGGMPRQEGMQRIVVPQDCSWLDGHMLDALIPALEKMLQQMGGGNPVKALMDIKPGSLSRKDILEDWWTGGDDYTGSGWGHGPRQLLGEILGLDTNIDSVFDAGLLSMLQYDQANLTGAALEKVKKDPAMVARENELVNMAKNDPRYGNEAFTATSSEVIGFGGERAPGEMWDQLKDPLNPKYRATWEVAGNELTWLVRNTNVTSTVNVAADGTMTLSHSFSDVFDLRPGDGRGGAYNTATGVLGTAYHDVLGGNDELRINAEWISKR